MIGRIDIRANAAHPNFPLPPVYMFAGAPSSPRVFGVPARMGSWAITAVSVAVAFPDNSTRTVSLTQEDGTWIGVIPACATTGAVQNGVQIVADGTDENGDAVTGYCLGVGDLFVMERDFTATADGTRYYFHYCEETPATPQVGDAVYADGVLKWWDGTAWRDFGGPSITIDPALSPTSENPVQNKVVTAALYTGFTAWVCGEITDGWTFETCAWMPLPGTGLGWYAFVNDGNGNERAIFLTADEHAVSASGDDATVAVSVSRHLITPTKTSQLTNDSGFLTQHQDISGKLDGAAAYPAWDDSSFQGYWPAGTIVSWKGKLYRTEGGTANPVEPGTSAGADDWAEITIQSLLAAKQDVLTAAQLANIAAVPSKANASDLPYAMVTPGEWEFSDGQSREIGSPEEVFEYGWAYAVENLGYSQNFSTEADALAALSLTFDGSDIIATRPSLPGHLCDRSGNRVVVSGDTTLTLPALEHAGKLRDFLVRLEISGSTVPTITFAAPTGETIAYETDGDEFPVPDDAGTWSYSFTENCVAHTFAVSLKKVNTVAQGGS